VLKLYLDNDVFSAMMVKQEPDMTEIENAAIVRIHGKAARNELTLVASEVHRREIDKVPGQHRAPYQSALGTLPQVEFVEDHTLLGFNTVGDPRAFVIAPLIEDDAIARVLRDLHCDVFLTCDGGILARREAIQRKFSIRIAKPSEFAP